MVTRKIATCTIIACFLALAGCAASPEEEHRRQEMEADIDDILSQYVDPAEYGEVKRCLSDMDFRRFEALDPRRVFNRQFLGEGLRPRKEAGPLPAPLPAHRLPLGDEFRVFLGPLDAEPEATLRVRH